MEDSRTSLEGDLPTITEEDGESVRSGSTTQSNPKSNGAESASAAASSAAAAAEEGKKEKSKREKKKKKKDAAAAAAGYSAEDHDTAQQILVDLCTEMKDLKNSMMDGQDKTCENLDSNQQVLRRLADQMGMLQGNMRELDQVIESKATPEQIEELARIRAVQEMMKVVTDDKERTVGVYEQHARRGYEEIERLRHDLESERKEVAALRAELDIVRGDRQRMMSGSGPANMYIHAGDSVGGSSAGGGSQGPGAMYINGGPPRRISGGGLKGSGSDFDDMTLETKGSYDTQVYEMKSLKKRIIHMKKKLTVAQMEAKETGVLRTEVERLRVQLQTEKKGSQAKDEAIKRLKNEIAELKRNQANAAAALAMVSGGPPSSRSSSASSTTPAASVPSPPPTHHKTQTKFPSRTVVTHNTKKSKWWQNI